MKEKEILKVNAKHYEGLENIAILEGKYLRK